MDYHLVFMIISIFLYFLCFFIIFTKPDKNEYWLVIVLAATNIYFSYLTALGFFQIGIIGVDPSTGETIVTGYIEMYQFYMIFFAMLMTNVGIIIYSILNVIRLKSEELAQTNYKKKWREGF